MEREIGLIHLYNGDGKGKTTAAIGLAIRAAGAGKKVVFSQFMKDGKSSELNILKDIDVINVLVVDKEYGFYKSMYEEDKQNITIDHNKLLDNIIEVINNNQCDVLIMDEVVYTYSYSLIDKEKIKYIIEESPYVEKVITGRNPDKYFLDKADYITEMKKIKHPYDIGIKARKGIEK